MAEITVTKNEERSRWEAHLDDAVVGVADYVLGDGMISFTHTEVPPEFGGRGIGGKLVQASLDDARAQGLLVNPICSYYTYWIVRHPEYADVVRH